MLLFSTNFFKKITQILVVASLRAHIVVAVINCDCNNNNINRADGGGVNDNRDITEHSSPDPTIKTVSSLVNVTALPQC